MTPLYSRNRSGAFLPIPLNQRASVRMPQVSSPRILTPPPAFTEKAVKDSATMAPEPRTRDERHGGALFGDRRNRRDRHVRAKTLDGFLL